MYCLLCHTNQAVKDGLLCQKCRDFSQKLLDSDKQGRQLLDEPEVLTREQSERECGTPSPTPKN